MKSTYTIVAPTEASVTLNLSWEDAKVLTRIVGLTNSGCLMEASPVLHRFFDKMVAHIGSNVPAESRDYEADISGGQIFLKRVYNA